MAYEEYKLKYSAEEIDEILQKAKENSNPPKYYEFVKGSTSIHISNDSVTRGIIATVRYGGNINQEVTVTIPKDSAFESETHRYFAALYLGTWRYVVVAINSGNLVLEYAGDGGSLNETSASYIKAESF